jgi:hypothetical protein
MMRKQIEHVDMDTGEIVRGCMVFVPDRPRITERWFMAFQDSFIELAQDSDLTLQHKNVLLYLFGKLDFENYIQQSQADIAKDLSIPKQNVSRAINLLKEKRILLEGPKVGRSKCYRLNANYGWKGKVKNLRQHLSLVAEDGVAKNPS